MWPTIARVAGFLLLLGTGWFYVISGLIVPQAFLFALWALWGAIVAFAVVKRHDWRYVLAAPFVAAALWFAILLAGDRFLGWTA